MSNHRTVYVVDVDRASRRGLTAHLASIGAEVWPFGSGAEFIAMLDHILPACILLDMEVTAPGGIDLLTEIRHRRPGWPVLAMSGRSDVEAAVEAMKLGAFDFLVKPFDAARLAAALVPAFASLEQARQAWEDRRRAGDLLARLSARELDIALALFGGRSNKSVAYMLGISVRTVEMHRANVMAKLQVKTLAEAAVLATLGGLTAARPDAPATDGPDYPLRRIAGRS